MRDRFEIQYEGDTTTVEALDMEDAAQVFAEHYFSNGDCQVPCDPVLVREEGEEAWTPFAVEGESVMVFSAREMNP